MGGQLGGPFRPRRTRGSGGGAPRFTSARLPNGGPGACPRFGRLIRCLVRLVKGKFVVKVRMGGELGGLGGEAPRFRPQRGQASRFRPLRTRGGPSRRPSGGLAPRFRPERLELTHFVTGSVIFFCGFSCISQPIYTPPKTPFFLTGPASLLVVIRGFPPHIIDTRA